MFTGIIECAGRVAEVVGHEAGVRLTIRTAPVAEEARIGDSVAVNGVCLTVVACEDDSVAFHVVTETLRRTSLGALTVGARVNLERPVRAGGRLDGHIVQGHVDGTVRLISVVAEGDSHRLRFTLPPEVARYVVAKGSLAVDGISLTVAALAEEWFEVAVIPHTWQVTNLGALGAGQPANLEVDVLAKYVERLLGLSAGPAPHPHESGIEP